MAHNLSAKVYLLKGKNVLWVDSASFVYHKGALQSGAAPAAEALLKFQKAEGQPCPLTNSFLQRLLVGRLYARSRSWFSQMTSKSETKDVPLKLSGFWWMTSGSRRDKQRKPFVGWQNFRETKVR